MEERIDRIDIVPAIFVKYRGDGNVLLRCLQGEETIDRAFEPRIFKGIENPKYLLLGVMTGGNMMKLTICDGNEFEKYFKTKWKNLISQELKSETDLIK